MPSGLDRRGKTRSICPAKLKRNRLVNGQIAKLPRKLLRSTRCKSAHVSEDELFLCVTQFENEANRDNYGKVRVILDRSKY